MPPHETLAFGFSRLNSETLAARVVLAHSRAVFHPCTCRLRGSTTVVAATLIGYVDVAVAAGTTTRRRRS
jgi:hypothetical protein